MKPLAGNRKPNYDDVTEDYDTIFYYNNNDRNISDYSYKAILENAIDDDSHYVFLMSNNYTPVHRILNKYVVSIRLNRKHHCGGCIIRADLMLIAAHCFHFKHRMVPISDEILYGNYLISPLNDCKKNSGIICVISLNNTRLRAGLSDSDAPLICDVRATGVVSLDNKRPDVYADVYYFRNWINSNVAYKVTNNDFQVPAMSGRSNCE
uniref:Peptidase S1 domain-containing protein n=1 Tax=Glossina brevipalpis TaxID=37001 RepID=A0A1A9WPF9_9MUSC